MPAGGHIWTAAPKAGSYSHAGRPLPGNYCRCVRGSGQTAERPRRCDGIWQDDASHTASE